MTEFLITIRKVGKSRGHRLKISAESIDELNSKAENRAVEEGFFDKGDKSVIKIMERDDKRPLDSPNCSDWMTVGEYARFIGKDESTVRTKIGRKALAVRRDGAKVLVNRNTPYRKHRDSVGSREEFKKAIKSARSSYAEASQKMEEVFGLLKLKRVDDIENIPYDDPDMPSLHAALIHYIKYGEGNVEKIVGTIRRNMD